MDEAGRGEAGDPTLQSPVTDMVSSRVPDTFVTSIKRIKGFVFIAHRTVAAAFAIIKLISPDLLIS